MSRAIDHLLYYFKQMEKPRERAKDLVLGSHYNLFPEWEEIVAELGIEEDAADVMPWELTEAQLNQAAKMVEPYEDRIVALIWREDPGEARSWMTIRPLERLRNQRLQWVVHCTQRGHAEDIVTDGFLYGAQLDTLALTHYRGDRKDGQGYNFGYLVGSREADGLDRYGGDCVVARVPDMLLVDHESDGETQVIFYGPDVPAGHIFQVQKSTYDGTYTAPGMDDDWEQNADGFESLEALCEALERVL